MPTAQIHYLDWEHNHDLVMKFHFTDYTPTIETVRGEYRFIDRDFVRGKSDDDLEELYRRWNRAPPETSEVFQRANVRNMSVGDIIKLDDTAYIVRSEGFEEIDV